MKTLCLLALALLVPGAAARAQGKLLDSKLDLPQLNVIKAATLSPCYGCRTPEEFSRGYEATALFLNQDSRQRNAPALLFNGTFGSPDFFQVSTAGAEMSVIADLGGGLDLAALTAHHFSAGIVSPGESQRRPMQFQVEAPVRLGHTYAVIINKGDYRGLLFFTVVGHEPNQRVELRYALKHFESLRLAGHSPGFDWTRGSTQQ